jgi:hypothetical protein
MQVRGIIADPGYSVTTNPPHMSVKLTLIYRQSGKHVHLRLCPNLQQQLLFSERSIMRKKVEHNELSTESFESKQNLQMMSAEPFPHDLIAQRAYQFWEERGRADGEALNDWLRAEMELRRSLDKSPNDAGIDAAAHQGLAMAEVGSAL